MDKEFVIDEKTKIVKGHNQVLIIQDDQTVVLKSVELDYIKYIMDNKHIKPSGNG